MAVGSLFFSAALTAQNRPDLHFRFLNYFIQQSLEKISGEYPLKIEKLITSIIFDGKDERIVGNNQDVFVTFYVRNCQATVGRFTRVQMKKVEIKVGSDR